MRIKHTIDSPQVQAKIEEAKDILDNRWLPVAVSVVASGIIGLLVVRKSSSQPIIINNYPR